MTNWNINPLPSTPAPVEPETAAGEGAATPAARDGDDLEALARRFEALLKGDAPGTPEGTPEREEVRADREEALLPGSFVRSGDADEGDAPSDDLDAPPPEVFEAGVVSPVPIGPESAAEVERPTAVVPDRVAVAELARSVAERLWVEASTSDAPVVVVRFDPDVLPETEVRLSRDEGVLVVAFQAEADESVGLLSAALEELGERLAAVSAQEVRITVSTRNADSADVRAEYTTGSGDSSPHREASDHERR